MNEQMNQNPQVPPQMPPQMPQMPAKNGASGLRVASILLIAVVVIGAIYFWTAKSSVAPAPGSQTEMMNEQSNSDAPADIESDLNNTNLDNVDYDLNESNFNAS